MELLYLFEQWRTPFLDRFFSIVTMMGEETLFIVAGLVFFWCVNKKYGYYLLTVGFAGLTVNQFLKLLFRVPRPWVQDEKFTIVESAREAAEGYSFPSGHTQSAVGVFGGIARVVRRWWVRVLCILAAALVAVSRLYLGVHTPLDVGVSIAFATVLVFAVYPLVMRAVESVRGTRLLFAVLLAIAAAYLMFVLAFPFPADINMHNLESGIKSAYTVFGCVIGLWIAYEVDRRYVQFETDGAWWAQLIKLALGLVLLLGIKEGVKAPLRALFGGDAATAGVLYISDAIRYLCVTLFAGCVWPLTFRYFARLGKKTTSEK